MAMRIEELYAQHQTDISKLQQTIHELADQVKKLTKENDEADMVNYLKEIGIGEVHCRLLNKQDIINDIAQENDTEEDKY
ncbi:hypothetical protein DFA_00964 [Cavenderia fasciculata]|uniref:Uncharacterized protein n=1 Tax=Cavenderia fasciculata TaxID=261658 RepID=F4PUS0_CACFS|nr:uncharacterized protein DFA_00964 [Cavenderia fasciculata]EGG21089.1 hypothetical protein DFA_00964 [Cavenderia fasciculata]|eukprot:XP_004358939.1 hypothetical protein DFA_00964 [Cavenderia fasciculata]